jgi:hypothetical protein
VHVTELAQHDVAGLQVTMEHRPAVRVVDRAADLHEGGQQPTAGEAGEELTLAARYAFQHGLQREPTHLLHGEPRHSVSIEAEVVDRHDGGVLEPALNARLPEKALHALGARRHFGVHHLSRDRSAQHRVVDQLHLPHAAFAEDRALEVAGAGSGSRVEGLIHGTKFSTAGSDPLDSRSTLRSSPGVDAIGRALT